MKLTITDTKLEVSQHLSILQEMYHITQQQGIIPIMSMPYTSTHIQPLMGPVKQNKHVTARRSPLALFT